MSQNNTSFFPVAVSVICMLEKQGKWRVCAILFIISTCVFVCLCVCMCKCVPEIKLRVLSHYTMALPQNYMNLKLTLFYLFVCGSVNVCMWTRGQKRVSGVLLCLSPAILRGRVSFLNPGLVFSQLSWSHQATASLVYALLRAGVASVCQTPGLLYECYVPHDSAASANC